MRGLLRGIFVLGLSSLSAAAFARQWAVIDGEVVGRADPNRYSVVVVAVDGKADFEAPTTRTISPGFHYVQIASTRSDRRGAVVYVPYAFMAEPCRRYVMYAQYESALASAPWQLVIDKDPKPLGGCKLPQQAQAQAQATTASAPLAEPARSADAEPASPPVQVAAPSSAP